MKTHLVAAVIASGLAASACSSTDTKLLGSWRSTSSPSHLITFSRTTTDGRGFHSSFSETREGATTTRLWQVRKNRGGTFLLFMNPSDASKQWITPGIGLSMPQKVVDVTPTQLSIQWVNVGTYAQEDPPAEVFVRLGSVPPYSEAQPMDRFDLRGGMHLELELDQAMKVSANPEADLQRTVYVLRRRIEDFGVAEPLIQQVGSNRIIVELAGYTDPWRAKSIIQRSAFLEVRLNDKTGALEKVLPRMDLSNSDTSTIGALASLLQPSRTVGFEGLPGEFAVNEAAFPQVDSLLHLPAIKTIWPPNVDFMWMAHPVSVGASQFRLLYVVEDRTIVTGANIVDADAVIDPLTKKPIVRFELDRAGARQFSEQAGRHIGDYLTTILDRRVYGCASTPKFPQLMNRQIPASTGCRSSGCQGRGAPPG